MLSFDAQLTQGKQSAGLQGDYGIASGLAAMLSGTGLEAVSQGGNNYGLRVAGAQTLAPVEVLGSREPGPSEGTDSYTVGLSTTATKLPMTLRETPQSVSVMTRQRLSDQGLNTLEDAIANTPGLTFKKKGSADDNEKGLYARGMEITNMQVDGVPTHKDFNALGLDTALYDRIEVVRGSTGLLNGAGNPAASINLVRKRPTQEFEASVGRPSVRGTTSARNSTWAVRWMKRASCAAGWSARGKRAVRSSTASSRIRNCCTAWSRRTWPNARC